MNKVFMQSTAGFVLRRLLPVAIVLPITIGAVRFYGQLVGWYDLGFGVTLVSTCNVVLMVLVVWKAAMIIDRMDYARNRQQEAVAEGEEFARAVVNSLSAHVAIVNSTGVIEAVNRRWGELMKLVEQRHRTQIGTNYLQLYQADDDAQSREFAKGLESVINGERQSFSMEYTVNILEGRRWLHSQILPFHHRGSKYAVVAHEDITALRQIQEELKQAYAELEIARALDLEKAQLEIIARLATAAEFRDDDTGKHIMRVGELAAAVAEKLELSASEVQLVRRAAPLHDIGKIAIPDAILLKAGKLTPAEYAMMQKHAEIGARLLGKSTFPLVQMAATIANYHHEKWDGTGYPERLQGNAIPLIARIVAIVDVFDALITSRPYKKAWTHQEALTEVQSQAGRHFDPRVVKAFVSIVSEEAR